MYVLNLTWNKEDVSSNELGSMESKNTNTILLVLLFNQLSIFFFFFFMFATTLYKLKAETEKIFLGFPKYRHIRVFAPHTFTFPSLYLILSHTFIKKKKKISLIIVLLPHLLNSLTSSSPQLITSPFHLPLSPSHLLNSLNSSSFQLIAPTNFLFKSYVGIFLLVSLWSLWFYCCLSLKGAFFFLWFLFLFFVVVFT